MSHQVKALCLSNRHEHFLRRRTEKTHVCEICNKTFSEISDVKWHLHVHIKEKPYFCEICNKAFSQRGTLKTHLFTPVKNVIFGKYVTGLSLK
ncbi:UNVERIFIED_CONTAM: Sall1 [Trichonephila clavipes]